MVRSIPVVAISLLCVVASMVSSSPRVSSSTTLSVSIPASQPWTDTGIDLQAGESVSITATGVIRIAGSDAGKTPAGAIGCANDPNNLVPALTCVSLIGRIGNGQPFEVGTSVQFTVPSSGRLYLGVNDSYFGDNSGYWTATISVMPSALLNYVALGDSYSSGDGAPPYNNDVCRVSANSFPIFLRIDHLDLHLAQPDNVACTGAKTQQVDQDQVSALKATDAAHPVNLITITVGGDDVDFATALGICYSAVVVASQLRIPRTGLPLPQAQRDAVVNAACTGQDVFVEQKITALHDKLVKVYSDVQSAAPSARILVVGYPDIFPKDPTGSCDYLPTGSVKWMNQKGIRLNSAIAQSVADANAAIRVTTGLVPLEFIDSWEIFQGNTVCSSSPWVNPISGQTLFDRGWWTNYTPNPIGLVRTIHSLQDTPFHPNLDGYKSLATNIHTYLAQHPRSGG